MKIVLFTIFYLVWIQLILFLSSSNPEFPEVRERFGTIVWHSMDRTQPKDLAYHTYCFYPKQSADTNSIIKRMDSGDCSNWYGEAILAEGWWVSEREKIWSCEGQLSLDNYNCDQAQNPLSDTFAKSSYTQ